MNTMSSQPLVNRISFTSQRHQDTNRNKSPTQTVAFCFGHILHIGFTLLMIFCLVSILAFDGHPHLHNFFGFIGSLLFLMISFRCQMSGYPIQSGWTTPLYSALLRSSTTGVTGCIRGEPGRSSAHSTYCVPDRIPILAHSSMIVEPRTNMSTSTHSQCKEEL